MPKKLEAVVAYTKVAKIGLQFTVEALKDVAKYNTDKKIIVLDNFNPREPIGVVLDLKYEDEKLIALIELYSNNEAKINVYLKNKMFAINGYAKRKYLKGDIHIIEKFELEGVSAIHTTKSIWED